MTSGILSFHAVIEFLQIDVASDRTETMEKTPNKRVVNAVALVLLPVLIFFALVMFYGFYEQLDGWNKIPHDKMTTVYSIGWQNGEYKVCYSFNQSTQDQEPELICETGEPPRVFKVRFWGRTFVRQKSSFVQYTWTCRKNGEADPMITCEYQKELKLRSR
jgi:hypothetical protein